jgi:predicted alpha/beta hydrolase family esterase
MSESTPGQPANLLDNSFAASKIAYQVERRNEGDQQVGNMPAGWSQVNNPPDTPRGAALAKAEAVELVGPNKQHYVAFAGSREPGTSAPARNDWETNLKNGMGEKTEKYEAAAKLGDLYKNENVVFTGHSLGGGLARTAAEVQSYGKTQGLAVTFDSAPIAPNAVLNDYGKTNPNKLHCNSIAVVSNTDTLNAVLTTDAVGDNTPEVVRGGGFAKNEHVLHALGSGSPSDGTGHGIAAMDDPNNHSHLTKGLTDKDRHLVNKGDFDRFSDAHTQMHDSNAVVQALDSARTQDRTQEQVRGR